MIMSDLVPNDESGCSRDSPETTAVACEYLAQRTAIRCCTDPYTPWRGLYELYETTDDRLLAISRACDRGRLYLERLAPPHDKKAQLRLIWTQAAHWLAFFAAMNLLLLTHRAEHAQCGCHRPRYSAFAGSRNLCCRCAHSGDGGLHTRVSSWRFSCRRLPGSKRLR